MGKLKLRSSKLSLLNKNLNNTAKLLNLVQEDAGVSLAFESAVSLISSALRNGGKILFAGNGGSAADSQHMAGEFVSRFEFDRPGLPAVALTTDSSILTAIGNDYGYEKLFARQVQSLANEGDVLVVYSTSGSSPNILASVKVAREMGVKTIALTGNRKGGLEQLCDICFEVPSSSTPRVQELHLIIGHSICGAVELEMFREFSPEHKS